MKDIRDKDFAEFIIPRKIKFQYFPKINLKNQLDPRNVEEARSVVDSQTDIIETKKDLKKLTVPKKPFRPFVYKWKPMDHINQTLIALKKELDINITECKIKTQNGVTTIYNKFGDKIASASPNGLRGINFVYIYPKNHDASPKRFAVDVFGNIQHEYQQEEFKDFQKFFVRNVKIDNNRTRPIPKNNTNV